MRRKICETFANVAVIFSSQFDPENSDTQKGISQKEQIEEYGPAFATFPCKRPLLRSAEEASTRIHITRC